jgi:hypothetical protein
MPTARATLEREAWIEQAESKIQSQKKLLSQLATPSLEERIAIGVSIDSLTEKLEAFKEEHLVVKEMEDEIMYDFGEEEGNRIIESEDCDHG